MVQHMSMSRQDAHRVTARQGEILTPEILRQVIPSAYAVGQHASRSARYTYVPTSEIIASMVRENFLPVFACQSRCRDAEKRDFTKHMIRFRQNGAALSKPEVPEVVLVNSHDGTSSYQLCAGIFRMVCTNGMIVGDKFEQLKVQHSGNILETVLNGAHTVAHDFERALGTVQAFKELTLTPDEKGIFAAAAADLRFEPKEGEELPVLPATLLKPRRNADQQNDLWTVLNTVQENAIKGGVNGVRNPKTGARRKTREVKGIDANVRLNRALWTLAEKMAELKR